MTTLAPPEVTLAEAVPLVGAFAARIADDAGIRLLLIKGQPATDLGVRADRPSVDVDVWVDPVRWDDYCGLLEVAGWTRSPSLPLGVGWDHAVTMTHAGWRSSVDVHRTFPGFLAEDSVAFEGVWRERTTAPIAGESIAVPSVVAAAIISVLHAERSNATPEPQLDAAAALSQGESFTTVQVDELRMLAAEAGVDVTAAKLLEAAGLRPGIQAAEQSAGLAEWNVRRAHREQLAIGWVIALKRAPWRDRPGLLRAALRPTEVDLANSYSEGSPMACRFRALNSRWRRGLLALAFARPQSRQHLSHRGSAEASANRTADTGGGPRGVWAR